MKKTWFSESLYDYIKISLSSKKTFYQSRSVFQKIQVLQNPRFGKFLTLDGAVQTTEGDEFIYHEIMVHPAMFLHPNPKNILVIGGGDGGILREALKHPIRNAYLVEIDKKVIDLCKKYIPKISKGSFSNKKVKIIIDDGAKFVRNTKNKFDIVIVDSSDPIGPARVLFTRRFYSAIKNILTPKGIMVRQSGSSFLQTQELKENYKFLKKTFPTTHVFLAAIPTYIGGFFTFLMASKQKNLTNPSKRTINNSRFKKLHPKTRYYNPDMHIGAFCIPEYIKRMVK